ncbi:MAG: M1 family metallopeptidase [Chitinophagales bacterium]|nr:M1 family metallopeptidase [Chitinophagales bacterium]
MKNYWLIAASILFVVGCKPTQELGFGKNDLLMDEVEVLGKKYPYRPAAERTNDLIHTALEVSFDWEKQYLYGEASLTLKPYFYPTNQLILDAKGMDITQVSLSGGAELAYEYDGMKLDITLDKMYRKQDTFSVYIAYISKPNELEKTEGLSAISDDKGLYFINPLDEEKNKPMQIWTQGEPESNSVWFPTIDKPNERCTQEIAMTVQNRFMAISNGEFVSDIDNADGTHTVSWQQYKPHAPYLFMMTIGEFAQIKDEWEGLSVDYFVEKEYENVAREIFGETPAMLTFFSDQLGVRYPWDKYWQVCVRDYVSGAMENTSAVIFGEFVQQHERELIDEDHEDIVSHELFHHWFGDLVTCESWANLPLNESFATYGEVLWREHRYGEDEKYRKVYGDMDSYFNEASRGKQVDMIRYHHDTAEDMFDSHSYAKGGAILNMLRDVVGDDAFFESLRVYLEDNKYQSVEIHNLRLAFEKVTGKDLNWFFNQWFLSAGHPVIDIDYEYTDSSVIVKMQQEPSVENNLLYTLPLQVDVYGENETAAFDIVFHQKNQSFELPFEQDVLWVNVDAKKSLLAEVNDNKTKAQWMVQYMLGKNMLDKLYALKKLSTDDDHDDEVLAVLRMALKDNYWFIQDYAAGMYPLHNADKEAIQLLSDLALNAPSSAVRASAISTLSESEDSTLHAIYEAGVKDSSYRVNAVALEAMMYAKPDAAIRQAEKWEGINNYDMIDIVSFVYSELGEADKISYFQKTALTSANKYGRLYSIYYYSNLLGNLMEPTLALQGISFIEDWENVETVSYAKRVAISSLNGISESFAFIAEDAQTQMNNDKTLSKEERLALESEILNFLHVVDRATEASERLSN